MHIAHFTNTYFPSISGVVRSVTSFRRGLTELGHNTFVFTQQASDYEDEEPFIFRYISLNIGLPYEFPATIPISPFMDRLIPSLKLDVIHAHHPVLLGQIAANKAQELNLPLVFTFHTRYREYSHYIPIPQERVQEFLREAIDLWLNDYIKQCDHIVVPSESMRQVLADLYEVDKPVTVVATGIDLRPYQSADGARVRAERGWGDDQVIISVSRLAAEKNWPTLLEAVAKLKPDHPRLRLVAIGDGPAKRKLSKLASKLGISQQVEFLGKLPFEEIPSYLKAADLFAFASTSETQGLVTLEAMAAGLPIVAVDAIGTSDVVEHEVDGLLTEDDSAALAAQIDRLLSSPEQLAHYRAASLKKAQSLEITKQSKKLLAVYEEVIKQKQAVAA